MSKAGSGADRESKSLQVVKHKKQGVRVGIGIGTGGEQGKHGEGKEGM